jgi:hypothetical protein
MIYCLDLAVENCQNDWRQLSRQNPVGVFVFPSKNHLPTLMESKKETLKKGNLTETKKNESSYFLPFVSVFRTASRLMPTCRLEWIFQTEA